MRIPTLVAALAFATAAAGKARAETDLNELFEREQSTLSTVSVQRMDDFFGVKRSKDEDGVSFTRAWVDAQPAARGDVNFDCLTEALYFEARGETVKGQFAVAEVIMNRVASAQFPNTMCGVIQQGTGRKHQCQFSYFCDGRKEVFHDQKAFERVSKVARAAIDGATGQELTDGATYYHTTAVRPRWSRSFTKTTRIGVHLFYRDDRYRTALTD